MCVSAIPYTCFPSLQSIEILYTQLPDIPIFSKNKDKKEKEKKRKKNISGMVRVKVKMGSNAQNYNTNECYITKSVDINVSQIHSHPNKKSSFRQIPVWRLYWIVMVKMNKTDYSDIRN